MLALEWIAEQKIAAAAERGELQDLPGSGQPLDLYEDPLVPEEMKMVKRILGNAEVGPQDTFIDPRRLTSKRQLVFHLERRPVRT